jgi:hypothetical protein
MCPSSQSWPPKLNRDTGQNSGAWLQRSSCSRPMPRRYPIKRSVRHRRKGNVLTGFDDGVFLLAVEPLTVDC